MKKVYSYILLLTIIFLAPNMVFAAENDTIRRIEIDQNVSLTYKINGQEFVYEADLYVDNNHYPDNIKIYRLERDGNKTEITDFQKSWDRDNLGGSNTNKYRLRKDLRRYYNGTNIDVTYIVQYTFDVDVNGTLEQVVYEKEISFISNDDYSSNKNGRVILAKLVGDTNAEFNYSVPKIKINKTLIDNAEDGKFTFNIKSLNDNSLNKNIEVTTNNKSGSSEEIILEASKKYVVSEINIDSKHKFVSMDSNFKIDMDIPNKNAIVIETPADTSETIEVNVINTFREIEHSKEKTDNNDGTHTLSLDVTGENEVQEIISGANVMIVFDVSSSMVNRWVPSLTGSYGSEDSNPWRGSDNLRDDSTVFYLYKKNGSNNYSRLLADEEYDGVVYKHTGSGTNDSSYTLFTGKRFQARRADVTEKVINDFLKELEKKQDDDNKSNIEVALVTFCGGTSSLTGTNVSWTSNISDITDKLSQTGYLNDALLDYDSGTNYEAALAKAIDELKKIKTIDDDQTFVIFVTDGQPSQSVTTGNVTDNNTRYKYYQDSRDEAFNVENYNNKTQEFNSSDNNTTLYGIYAYGDEEDYLDDLIYYAHNEADRPESDGGVTKETVDTEYYYNAANTIALQNAINEIFNDISNYLGIKETTIADGTTNSVKTTLGVDENLLTIDENSFNYWLSFKVEDGNKIRFNSDIVTVTKNPNADNYILTDSSVYVNGYFSDNDTIFHYKWESGNELYNFSPPEAFIADGSDVHYAKGTVVWDLKNIGLLLNDVKYTVKFDVWPSQYTYDLISDLKNGKKDYDTDIDKNIRDYLIKNSDGSYTLLTNTVATLTYTDTRNEDEGEQLLYYNSLKPIETGVSEIDISKTILNYLDPRDVDLVKIDLLRNGNTYGNTVELTKNSNGELTGSTFISVGLISTIEENGIKSDAVIRENGYDYTFDEIEAYYNNKKVDTYHWDLLIDTIRPMMIDKDLKMLVKTTDKDFHGKHIILENNKVKYVLINGVTYEVFDSLNGKVDLNAVNSRRANLNLIKEISELSSPIPEDTMFTFEVTVDSTDDEDLWFSVYESPTSDVVIKTDDVVVGATNNGETIEVLKEYRNQNEFTGFYYVKDNSTITINLKAGWNLRFINIPLNSTYTITEILNSDFRLYNSYVQTSYKNPDTVEHELIYETADSKYTTIDKAKKMVSGDIYISNRNFNITYVNIYALTEVRGTKTWVDNNNYDNKRPSSIAVVLTGKVGNTVVSTTRLTVSSSVPTTDEAWNTNTVWNYAVTKLPLYDENNNIITYTVSEDLGELSNLYKSSQSGNNFTNIYIDTHKDFDITKVWNLNGTQVPESVRLELYYVRNNNEVIGGYKDLSKKDYTDTTWTTKIKLPIYYEDDNNNLVEITYLIRELSINGNSLVNNSLDVSDDNIWNIVLGKWTAIVNNDTLTVTNTWNPANTAEFKFTKVRFHDENYNPLTGAIFRLYRYIGRNADGTADYSKLGEIIDVNNLDTNYWVEITTSSGNDGYFNFNSLYEGEYRLVEIKAPDSYILPAGQWHLHVTPNEVEKVKISSVGLVPALIDEKNGEYYIPNQEIPSIPSTGGIGIPNYKQNGLLLMVLSICILIINQIITNKKQENF